MQVSFNGALQDGRAHYAIGRVRAVGRWRAAHEAETEADRRAVLEALGREAEDYGAEALTDVKFEVDEISRGDIDGLTLRRLVATGSAVRFAVAA